MKKNMFIAFAVVSALLVSLTGCGANTPTTNNTPQPLALAGSVTTLAQVGVPGAGKGVWDMVALNSVLYVCDKNGSIATVTTAGVVGLVPVPAGKVVAPEGIATDGTNLYVSDKIWHQIWQVNPTTGAATLLAGSTIGTAGNVNGASTTARFNLPDGIAVVGNNLYICDINNNAIRQYNLTTQMVSTVTVAPALNAPWDIVTDGTNLYVTEATQIRKIPVANPAGNTVLATGSFLRADGITIESTNTDLYVSDANASKIFKVNIASGTATLVAGNGTAGAIINGTGAAAQFNLPDGLAIIGSSLYVADNANYAIRKIQ